MKNHQEEFYPAALTISASDSGGTSGIQADLRTFNAAGIYGCSAVTAIAARSPRQMAAFSVLAPELVKAEIESVLADIAIKAVKIGMLGSENIVNTVANILKKHKLPIIVAPAMFTDNGTALLDNAAMEALQKEILPLADMIILNLPEAEYLTKSKLKNEKDYTEAAVTIAGNFKSNVLLTTAFTAGKHTGNVVVLDKKLYTLTCPPIGDQDEFTFCGINCTLSSGITAMIAAGNNWKDAVVSAMSHLFGAMSETANIGRGLNVMYPPLEDYSRFVALRSMQKNSENKGARNAR